ncbi:hypothetical protein Phum_PHUM383910 [Pediculus humanus corporis]|uniref:CUB domain-containing protein n=1 Tax=Pediculus humanus subsp. corporis TaxID=121224 RepID=E0VQT1_PEDHC|nr:uncharacterized protein Phum_PHUM383910 [Pediculus humanus corporis]EEB15737.1 hypothetical protein Phum_PHUM383910 [Pediculus humanus corporis]
MLMFRTGCEHKGCQGGYLQLVDGSINSITNKSEIKICGNNDRYDPPVLIFADNDDTTTSQFIAYFSFTSITNEEQGNLYKGGKKIAKTDCDWLYQDFECRAPESCVLTSPGYPGLYVPNRLCKYHIAISSMQTKVKISFASVLLPEKQCKTDFIAIHQGTTVLSPVVGTICGTDKKEFIFYGPNLLLEFRSGPSFPPYNYNGFQASLEFFEQMNFINKNSSHNIFIQTTESNFLMDSTSSPKTTSVKNGCDISFSGNVSRSGTFDTRTLKWRSTCLFTFTGRATDVVHISLFNYYLSPVSKRARDSLTGRFIEQQSFVSTDNTFSIRLKRSLQSHKKDQMEFVDGAFLFHDEQVDGTLRPLTLCDVDYYGLSSSTSGQVNNPGSQDLYFNIERPLRCVDRFVPAANQSITLTISRYKISHLDPYCHTQCGDGGCFCVVLNSRDLSQVDHLMLQTDSGQILSCLCGEFQEDWLPVTLKSWSALNLIYYVAHFTWEEKGFNFTTNYSFNTDGICGHYTFTAPDGEIESIRIIPDGQLNYYYHQKCTWLLDTKIERQLTIELYTPQNRHCGAWNLTLHDYDESSSDRTGTYIDIFCPRQRHKVYKLPWKMNLVVVRLQATTHTPPEFTIKWRSQVFRSNNRISDPLPSPSWAIRDQTTFLLFLIIICLKNTLCISQLNLIIIN